MIRGLGWSKPLLLTAVCIQLFALIIRLSGVRYEEGEVALAREYQACMGSTKHGSTNRHRRCRSRVNPYACMGWQAAHRRLARSLARSHTHTLSRSLAHSHTLTLARTLTHSHTLTLARCLSPTHARSLARLLPPQLTFSLSLAPSLPRLRCRSLAYAVDTGLGWQAALHRLARSLTHTLTHTLTLARSLPFYHPRLLPPQPTFSPSLAPSPPRLRCRHWVGVAGRSPPTRCSSMPSTFPRTRPTSRATRPWRRSARSSRCGNFDIILDFGGTISFVATWFQALCHPTSAVGPALIGAHAR